MARAAAPILAGQSPEALKTLLGLARINAKRNDSIWKMAALFYISGPTGFIVLGFQIAPKLTRAVLTLGAVGFGLCGLALALSLLHYYSINWRAAQIVAVVEMEMVERGLDISG